MTKQNIMIALERAFAQIREEEITDVPEIEQIVYDEIEAEYEFEQDTSWE